MNVSASFATAANSNTNINSNNAGLTGAPSSSTQSSTTTVTDELDSRAPQSLPSVPSGDAVAKKKRKSTSFDFSDSLVSQKELVTACEVAMVIHPKYLTAEEMATLVAQLLVLLSETTREKAMVYADVYSWLVASNTVFFEAIRSARESLTSVCTKHVLNVCREVAAKHAAADENQRAPSAAANSDRVAVDSDALLFAVLTGVASMTNIDDVAIGLFRRYFDCLSAEAQALAYKRLQQLPSRIGQYQLHTYVGDFNNPVQLTAEFTAFIIPTAMKSLNDNKLASAKDKAANLQAAYSTIMANRFQISVNNLTELMRFSTNKKTTQRPLQQLPTSAQTQIADVVNKAFEAARKRAAETIEEKAAAKKAKRHKQTVASSNHDDLVSGGTSEVPPHGPTAQPKPVERDERDGRLVQIPPRPKVPLTNTSCVCAGCGTTVTKANDLKKLTECDWIDGHDEDQKLVYCPGWTCSKCKSKGSRSVHFAIGRMLADLGYKDENNNTPFLCHQHEQKMHRYFTGDDDLHHPLPESEYFRYTDEECRMIREPSKHDHQGKVMKINQSLVDRGALKPGVVVVKSVVNENVDADDDN